MSIDFTVTEVAEAKVVVGGTVKNCGSNEDWLQSQLASAPNPQNLKLLAEFCCSMMISFA